MNWHVKGLLIINLLWGWQAICQSTLLIDQEQVIADTLVEKPLPDGWLFAEPVIEEPSGARQKLAGTCKSWKCLEKKLMTYLELWGNWGHIYARVILDSLYITTFRKDTLINTLWQLDTGAVFIYDTIRHSRPLPVQRKILERYLRISYTKPVRYSDLRAIRRRLAGLPQVAVDSISGETYEWGRANWYSVRMSLRENATSNIQGSLSFSQKANGQVILTGFALLDFKNMFRRLIELNVKWNGMTAGQQNLLVSGDVPFIVGLWGVSAFAELYRQDSSFVRVRYRAGALLTSDVTINPFVERYLVLPAFDTTVSAVSTMMGGIRIKIYRSDNLYFPFKGFNMELVYSGGNRITETGVGFVHRLEGWSDIAINMHKARVFFISIRGQALLGNNLQEEEAYSIGGTGSVIGLPDGEFKGFWWSALFLSFRKYWQDLIVGLFVQPAYLSSVQGEQLLLSGGFESHFLLEKSYISIMLAVSTYPQQATLLQRFYVHISYGLWNRQK